MKKRIVSISVFLWIVFNAVILPNNINAQVKAFPGAFGFGEYVTGGRTGTVYHVTTLADAGAGSFRDAVSKSNRIIVFDVCGYINLLSGVSASSNLTIAGQTAPGGGIGFTGNAPAGTKAGEISFSNRKNIICRHIRIRPGRPLQRHPARWSWWQSPASLFKRRGWLTRHYTRAALMIPYMDC